MADAISSEQRSKNMRAIRSQSKLENEVSKALWKKGIRFRKNNKKLYGQPDISIKKYKIVIFIDSCFWHGCELHGTIPKSNNNYWTKKLQRNKARDAEVTAYYVEKGWFIKRVWEHELKEKFEDTIEELTKDIEKVKATTIKRN